MIQATTAAIADLPQIELPRATSKAISTAGLILRRLTILRT
ncbi:hypothetical protein [Paraburkholderia sp. D1E]